MENFENANENLAYQADPPSFLRAKQQRLLALLLAEKGVKSLAELDTAERRELLVSLKCCPVSVVSTTDVVTCVVGGQQSKAPGLKGKRVTNTKTELEPGLYKDLHDLLHEDEMEERRKRRALGGDKRTDGVGGHAEGPRPLGTLGGGGSVPETIGEGGEDEEAEDLDAELNRVEMGDMSDYIRPHHEAAEREKIWVSILFLG